MRSASTPSARGKTVVFGGPQKAIKLPRICSADSAPSCLPRSVQVEILEVAVAIEHSAPDFGRGLVTRRAEANDRSDSQVEISNRFQSVDQLFRRQVGSRTPQSLDEALGRDKSLE